MSLAQDLQARVSAFVAEELPLAALREWLDAHAQFVEDSDDAVVARLADDVWILLAELDRGHRDEAAVRAELRKSLDHVVPLRHGHPSVTF